MDGALDNFLYIFLKRQFLLRVLTFVKRPRTTGFWRYRNCSKVVILIFIFRRSV